MTHFYTLLFVIILTLSLFCMKLYKYVKLNYLPIHKHFCILNFSVSVLQCVKLEIFLLKWFFSTLSKYFE